MGEEYEVLELIGRGSFGQIHKVRRIRDGLILARKEISYNRMSAKEKEQLTAEFSILSKLQHPNIVRYYNREHNKADQSLYIYMEYCGGGDLSTQIKRCKSTGALVPEQVVWSIFTQLVLALYKCHNGADPPTLDEMTDGWEKKKRLPTVGATAAVGSTGVVKIGGREVVVHRDLKPENVFLDHETCVKLGDFGLSRILASDQHMATTYVGTPYYMSPEIVCDLPYTSKSDIWSLGCVIYELCALSPPFDAKSLPSLCQKIQAGRYNAIPNSYSPELRRVIDSCLRTNPSDRPDTAKLLDLQIIRTIRRELDALEISKSLKSREESLKRKEKDLETAEKNMNKLLEEAATRMRAEIDAELRKVWDEKAEDEIRRRVDLEVTRRCTEHEAEMKRQYQEAIEAMQSEFQTALEKQVTEEIEKRLADDMLTQKIGGLDVEERETPSTVLVMEPPSISDILPPNPTIVRSSSAEGLHTHTSKPDEFCPASPMDITMMSPMQAFNNGFGRRLTTQQASPLQRRGNSKLQTLPRSFSSGNFGEDDSDDEDIEQLGILPNKQLRSRFINGRNMGSNPGRQGLARIHSAPIHHNPVMAIVPNPSTPPRGRRTSSGSGMLRPNPGAENRQLSPNRRLTFGTGMEARKTGGGHNVNVKTAVMNITRARSILDINKEKKGKENEGDNVPVWDLETMHDNDIPSPFKKK